MKSKTVTVEIKDFAFAPGDIEISPGDKVTFVNRDQVKHSAVADDGSFDTGLLGQDESKTVTFEKEGTFSYSCGPHPAMIGKIIVKTK
ncbi:cupredoxin family copper-binding protein [Cohnella sp. CFH 77786]|uniref:cupredoxin domain-containing protein n=1 Tax=Cohnella sp. CFH 77786 TaxID=2662265 RepID=UPI001C60BF1B